MSDNNNPEGQSSEVVSSLRDRFYVGGEDLLGSIEDYETLLKIENMSVYTSMEVNNA
jgi:hypothetical protein